MKLYLAFKVYVEELQSAKNLSHPRNDPNGFKRTSAYILPSSMTLKQGYLQIDLNPKYLSDFLQISQGSQWMRISQD